MAHCVELQAERLLHPQCTTRIRRMLSEAAETITWALLSAETPRPSCFLSCFMVAEARILGETIGKDSWWLPGPMQVGSVSSHMTTLGYATKKLQIKCQRVFLVHRGEHVPSKFSRWVFEKS